MFLHAAKTGLREGPVRNHMIPYLDHDRPQPDDLLLREINIATSEEKERESKQRANKGVRVASVETNEGVSQLLAPLVDVVSEMKAQIEELTSRVNAMPSGANRNQRNGRSSGSWKKKGCEDCTRNNRSQCSHCWKCGKEGHQSKSCQHQPKGKPNNLLNCNAVVVENNHL